MRDRPGIFFSAAGHATALVVGLVAFSSPKPIEMPEDSIPVDVISAEDFTQLTKGSKVAPKAEAAPKRIVDRQAPEEKIVEDPAPKVDKTEVKTASAPPPMPEPRPKPPEPTPVAPPVPQPAPAPPEARRRPDPEPEPPKVEPKPVAKVAPAPEPKKKPEPTLEDKLAELAKEPPKPEKKPDPKPEPKPEAKKPEPKPDPKPVKVAEAKPTPDPKPSPAKPAPAAPSAPANPEKSFNPADIRALLDKRPPSRTEATGQTPPSRTATLGSPVGTAPRLSQSEIDALRGQIQQCWNPLVGAGAETLIVKIRIGLGPDGALNAQPQIVNRGNGAFQAAADAAIRAVRRCAPYKLPAAKYDAWKDVEITFDPRDMLRG